MSAWIPSACLFSTSAAFERNMRSHEKCLTCQSTERNVNDPFKRRQRSTRQSGARELQRNRRGALGLMLFRPALQYGRNLRRAAIVNDTDVRERDDTSAFPRRSAISDFPVGLG